MTAKLKFKSGAFEGIHASATSLLEVGAIDTTTMREFDECCLAKPPDHAAFLGLPPFLPFSRAAAALASVVATPPRLPISRIHLDTDDLEME